MDGSAATRDLLTAAVGAALGAVAAWALVAAVTAGPGDVAVTDARAAAAPSAVIDRWEVAGPGWQRAVVQVRNERCGGSVSGTGVVIDGHVLTNAHVVAGTTRLVVGTHDGRTIKVSAVAVSASVDLAELTLDGGPDAVDLLDRALGWSSHGVSSSPRGRWTMAGFPAGTHYRVRDVAVTDVLHGGRFPDPGRAWHLDADVAGGESGSPIVDGNGRLAGLLYARALTDGDGLAMDAVTLRDARRDLLARPFVEC